MEATSLGVSVFLLATLIEGFTEYALADLADKAGAKRVLKYVPLALGVLAAVAYKVDILASLGVVSSVPFVGSVVSGLIIGRGSNYVNDIVSRFREKKPA